MSAYLKFGRSPSPSLRVQQIGHFCLFLKEHSYPETTKMSLLTSGNITPHAGAAIGTRMISNCTANNGAIQLNGEIHQCVLSPVFTLPKMLILKLKPFLLLFRTTCIHLKRREKSLLQHERVLSGLAACRDFEHDICRS